MNLKKLQKIAVKYGLTIGATGLSATNIYNTIYVDFNVSCVTIKDHVGQYDSATLHFNCPKEFKRIMKVLNVKPK